MGANLLRSVLGHRLDGRAGILPNRRVTVFERVCQPWQRDPGQGPKLSESLGCDCPDPGAWITQGICQCGNSLIRLKMKVRQTEGAGGGEGFIGVLNVLQKDGQCGNGMEPLIFRDQRPLITTPKRFYRVGARLQSERLISCVHSSRDAGCDGGSLQAAIKCF